jgi:HEAT repeat protein
MAMSDRSARFDGEDEEVRRRSVHAQLGVPLDQCRDLLWSALGDASWRVRKEAVDVLVAARPGRDEINSLITLLRDQENAGLRNATAELLIRLGKRSVPVLMAYLHDLDLDLRKQVVDALAAIGDRSAVPGLVAALGDRDINVAAAAAEALGAIGDSSVAPALLRALEQHPHEFFRFNALAALGRIGRPGPLPPVVVMLAQQDMLQLAVYECLGKIGGDTAAADLLLEGVLTALPSVRTAAIRSLASVLQNLAPLFCSAVVENLRVLADQGLLETLAAAFDKDDLVLSEAVVILLEALLDPRGVPLLMQAMGDERLAHRAAVALKAFGVAALEPATERFTLAGEAERAAICALLGQLGQENKTVTTVISDALTDDAPVVRQAAALAVGSLSSVELLTAVAGLLDDEEPAVREAALQTLRARGSSEKDLIRGIAAQMLASDLPEQRQGAALLCAAVGDCDQLERLIKDEDPAVREAGVRAVGRLRLADSCSSLLMALVDEVEDVRIAAAESLGSCCAFESATASLRLALHDPAPWVQAAALRSLVGLAGEEALPDILGLWQRGDEVAQLACLEAFDRIAVPEGFALISQALGQRDGEVLKSAIEILARHAPELLTPWLGHILSHQDWDVRMTAVRACAGLPEPDRVTLLRMTLEHEDHDLVRQAVRRLLDSD